MKRGTVIAIAAGVVVILAGGGLAWWLLTRPPSADAAAATYLHALSEGDFDTIAGMLPEQPSTDPDQLRTAFAGASAYISPDYEVELTDDSSGMTGARASVDLAGSPATVFFSLALVDGRWMLGADYLATLTATTTLGDSVRVGDALVPAATPVPLLPAEYLVAAAPSVILSGSESVAVTNEQPVEVAIEASLSPEATALAQEQLDAYAQACAEPAAAVPANCGLRVPWAADLATLDTIAFRIEQPPVVTLSPDAGTFAATDGIIVATATGATRDGTAASFTYRADDWALRGAVSFAGDEMVLRVS